MSLINLMKNNLEHLILKNYPQKTLIKKLAEELIQFSPNDESWVEKVNAFSQKLELQFIKKKNFSH